MDNQTLKEKYLSFEGRLNRKRFIVRLIVILLIGLVITIPVMIIHSSLSELFRYFSIFIKILLLVPILSLCIRRLHDLNRTGQWIVFSYAPLFCYFVIIYTTFFKGTTGPNKYGTDPLESVNNTNQRPTINTKEDDFNV